MSSKTKTKTQETSQQDPWAPAVPFLNEMLGNANGIFSRYRSLTPQQTAAIGQGTQVANDRLGSGMFGRLQNAGMNLVEGGGRANVNGVSQASTPSGVRPGTFTAATVDPSQAYGAMGQTNPSAAISKLLTGQVDNPQLQRMAEAATRTGQRTYRDAVEDSTTALTEEVLPSIGRGAQLAGQFGGSRQGIAEGKALAERERTLGRNARELGIASEDAAAGMFGRAYESAQDRMAGTANAEAARALQVAEANASREQQAGMFNIGTGLEADQFNTQTGLAYDRLNTDVGFQNNDQAMRQAALNASLQQQGAGMFGQGLGLEDEQIGQLLDYLGYPAQWELGLLSPTAGVIGNIGGMGGTRSSTGTRTTKQSNPMGMISNGLLAASMLFPPTAPFAAGLTAGMGPIVSDLNLKVDIATVAYDARGRRWVDFAYAWAPEERHRGLIAQEALRTDPQAVIEHPAGFLMVDYSKLEAA
jgi:hypothetical protein